MITESDSGMVLSISTGSGEFSLILETVVVVNVDDVCDFLLLAHLPAGVEQECGDTEKCKNSPHVSVLHRITSPINR